MRRFRDWQILTLVLCSGFAPARAQTPDKMRPAGEAHPQNSRVGSDEQLLKASGIPTDGPGLLKFFRKRTLTDFSILSRPDSSGSRRAIHAKGADQERILALVRRLGERSFRDREQASRELIEIGIPTLPPLRAARGHADLEVQYRAEYCIGAIENNPGPQLAAAAVRLLRQRHPEPTCATLLAYLPFADDETVEEEILITLNALAVRDGKPEPSLQLALQSGDAERRAAAALVLGQHGNAEQRPFVRRLLTDVDGHVRLRAAQGLIAGREAGATATLISLLGEGGFEEARQAEEMLSRMAGDRAPRIDLENTEAGRRRCRDAWVSWWKFNKDRLDLTHASDFVVLNPMRKACDGIQQYMRAYIDGDVDLLRRMSELPFYDLESNRVLRTREALEKTLQEAIMGRNDNNLPLFSVTRVQGMNEFLKSVPANRRGVLAKLRRPDIRAVWVNLLFEDALQNGETILDQTIFFIRIGNGTTRVVGTANDDLAVTPR